MMKEIRKEISVVLSKYTGLDQETVERMIETPPDPALGDYAFPCFQLSKQLRKAPRTIASELAGRLEKPEMVGKIESAGGYVNFFIDRSSFAEHVLKEINERGAGYGASDMGRGKTVVIDYCAANIAKPFYVHHLPTTVIGNSLYRIYKFLGYRCVGVNHIGDWGTQFGKLVVAYKKWGSEETLREDPIGEMVRLYVRFHREAETDESLNDLGRAAFKEIEAGNEEYVGLWKWFREISIAEFKRVLDILKVEFDSWDGESFYNDKMGQVVEVLREKGLLVESRGALVVDLDAYGMPPCIILRSDGATLYATRDIAAALYRRKKYDFYKVLYCVATQQNLHFRQVFKTVELMGCGWAKDLVHVANGMISLESGSMSTRRGTAVYLEDVLKEAVSKALRIIDGRNPDLEGKEETAGIIGIGAVKFSVLKNRRMKDTVFEWDKALNFEGETSCYIQYTYARICSVLRKAGCEEAPVTDGNITADGASFGIIRQLAQFPEAVENAAMEYEPSILSKYLIDLVQSFNRFYHDNPILGGEGGLKESRLLLCSCVKTVIGTGMSLLGIDCPERM